MSNKRRAKANHKSSPPNSNALSWIDSLEQSIVGDWQWSVPLPSRELIIEALTNHCLRRRQPTSPADLGAMAWGSNWKSARHLTVLDRALVELTERKFKRLLVMMPPRHGKSVLISQFFPVWYLSHYPNHRVILASYAADFAAKWGRQTRDIVQQLGAPHLGFAIRRDSSAANRWDILRHAGGMVTAGVGGPITGRGADLLIVDDPVKNAEQALSETYRSKTWEWWVSTAFTRLEPGAIAVIVQTRWHESDLAGRVLCDQKGENWHVLRLPAIATEHDCLGRAPGEALWPERYPIEALENTRRSLPTSWWLALYQQQPGTHESLLFPAEYFRGDDLWFDDWPPELKWRVIALDPSKGQGTRQSDYSAYVLLGVESCGTLWVEADLSNSRPPEQIVEDGLDLEVRFHPDMFRVESNAWQDLLRPMFAAAARRRGWLRFEPAEMHNRLSKRMRIESLDSVLRERMVRFRRTPGTELLVQQLRDYPNGRHDDGPDALEMAVRAAQESSESLQREILSRLR